jgi:hypothetical protein
MSRIKRAKPALVVAVLTLIAAVAGTALAGSGPDANTAGAAKTAKKALKKAKKALKKANANATLLDELCGPGASAAGSETCTAPQGPKGDTGSQGLKGDTGSQGPKGEPGTNGTDGTNGTNGTAVAFAHVNSSGASVFAEDSQNVTDSNVTKREDAGSSPLTGQYCFHDLWLS